MTDNEIRDFFRKQFAVNPLRRAFSETYKRIGSDLLDKYLKPEARPSDRKFIYEVNDALSRISMFSKGRPGRTTLLIEPGIEDDIAIIYKQWRNALRYFFATYDTCDCDTVRRRFKKSDLSDFIDAADELIEKNRASKNPRVKMIIPMNSNLITYIQEIFLMAYAIVLGDKRNEFTSEFERQFDVLFDEHNIAVEMRRIVELGNNIPGAGNA